MRNFTLGLCCGFILGVVGMMVSLSGAQSTSPYAPSQLMGETNLYNAMITQDADLYLQRQRSLYDAPLPMIGGSGVPCP